MAILATNQLPVLYGSPVAPRRSRLAAFAGQPVLQQIDPTADLRSQQITAGGPAPETSRQAAEARNRVSSFSGYSPYTAPNVNDQYTDRANQYATAAYQSGQFSPLPNTSTAPVQATLDQLRGLVGRFGQVGGGLSYGPDVGQLRGALTSRLQNLEGPDRSQLAKEALSLYEQESEPGYQQRLRQVGQQAAAQGRIGAGMTTSELGDVTTLRERELARRRQETALRTAGETLADRLASAQAVQGGISTLGGLDQAAAQAALQGQGLQLSGLGQGADVLRGLASDQLTLARLPRTEAEEAARLGLEQGRFTSGLAEQAFGMGRGLRGEQREDEAARFGREQAELDARRGIFGDLVGYEGQEFGRAQTRADELRGERGYQTGQAQQGIENAIRQRALEDQLVSSGTGRNIDVLRNLYDLGYGSDPTEAFRYQGGVEQEAANQAFGGAGDLLSTILQQQAQRRAGAGSPSTVNFPTINLPPIGPFGNQPMNWQPRSELAAGRLPFGGFRAATRPPPYGSFRRGGY